MGIASARLDAVGARAADSAIAVTLPMTLRVAPDRTRPGLRHDHATTCATDIDGPTRAWAARPTLSPCGEHPHPRLLPALGPQGVAAIGPAVSVLSGRVRHPLTALVQAAAAFWTGCTRRPPRHSPALAVSRATGERQPPTAAPVSLSQPPTAALVAAAPHAARRRPASARVAPLLFRARGTPRGLPPSPFPRCPIEAPTPTGPRAAREPVSGCGEWRRSRSDASSGSHMLGSPRAHRCASLRCAPRRRRFTEAAAPLRRARAAPP